MTDKEFENLWQEKRERILLNNDEYQNIKRSYTQWNLIDYILLIGGFIICENNISTFGFSIVFRYLLSIAGMFLIWIVYRICKARFSNKKTLLEVEKEIKQRYRDALK